MHPVAEVRELKPGMSGEVSILTRHDNAVLVPREAVRRQDGQSTLFIIQDGNALLQKVDLGLVDDKVIEILEGIQPRDLVVVSGQNLLNEGDPVNIEGPSIR